MPLQIAHLKSSGRANWPLFDRALALIDAARARRLDVTADVYPYAASSTFLSALLPDWVHDGGIARALERIRDPATRRRLIAENSARWTLARRAGHARMERDHDRHLSQPSDEGLTLAELAAKRGKPAAEAMLDLLSRA